MKNITKLSFWPQLQQLGFTPVTYKAHGRTTGIGASLYAGLTELINIEPHSQPFGRWIYRTRFQPKGQIGGGIGWIETRDLYEQIKRSLEQYTVTYVMLFKCDNTLFKNPIVKKIYEHSTCFTLLRQEMEAELNREIELFYKNGDKREGQWSCSFHRVMSSGQAFEFDELYRMRCVVDYREQEKAEIIKELAAYGITNLEHETHAAKSAHVSHQFL